MSMLLWNKSKRYAITLDETFIFFAPAEEKPDGKISTDIRKAKTLFRSFMEKLYEFDLEMNFQFGSYKDSGYIALTNQARSKWIILSRKGGYQQLSLSTHFEFGDAESLIPISCEKAEKELKTFSEKAFEVLT